MEMVDISEDIRRREGKGRIWWYYIIPHLAYLQEVGRTHMEAIDTSGECPELWKQRTYMVTLQYTSLTNKQLWH